MIQAILAATPLVGAVGGTVGQVAGALSGPLTEAVRGGTQLGLEAMRGGKQVAVAALLAGAAGRNTPAALWR